MNSPPGDVEPVADVEGLAGRGLVVEREHRGIDEVVDVASPAIARPPSTRSMWPPRIARAISPTTSVEPGPYTVAGRRITASSACALLRATDLGLGLQLGLRVPVAKARAPAWVSSTAAAAGIAVDVRAADVDEALHRRGDGGVEQVARALRR